MVVHTEDILQAYVTTRPENYLIFVDMNGDKKLKLYFLDYLHINVKLFSMNVEVFKSHSDAIKVWNDLKVTKSVKMFLFENKICIDKN